jgi:hypothetical protein
VAEDNTIRPDEQRLIDGIELLKATEGQIEPDPIPGELSVAHADYLAANAVDLEVARSLGVRTLTTAADTVGLPHPWENFRNFPAILFPWTNEEGRTEYQAKADSPTKDQRGRVKKYIFRKDMVPVLWALRPVPDAKRIVIVEGTKQALAAASHAAPDVAVYGIAGCRSWQKDGVPIPDLMAADGREVVVILDADAATNPDVYAAGLGLAEALAMEGATKVKFGRLPGGGKSGLDDVLAGRAPAGRAGYLARIIDGAKAKPADTKPKPRKKSADLPEGDSDRVTIICNRDRLEVINDLTRALLDRWNARELFNHGGVISRLKGQVMKPVDRGAQRDLIQETAVTVDEIDGAQGITYNFTWPDANSISAVMSRADRFAPLERISHAPFVRPDGSICTTPGYDEPTRTILVPDAALEGLEVPERPTEDEVASAVKLIMTEWLGDFPFDADADRANVLALVVTPAIRGLVPKVPMAVVDGLQMGVGKNLLADMLMTVYTGDAARPMNWVDEHEELRKQITSAFRTGQEFFIFDEAHTIRGAALAQALTAETWQDRILGVSNMAEFPNRVTWVALGNNVQVQGDITRRVYRIALRPTYSNPQDRPASSFYHPGVSGLDLGSWTRKHRRDLMTAILTVVRAWFAAGQPAPRKGVSFGSFEAWERIVGGIVETAGLPGFLANLKVWRSESDFDTQYWIGHLGWLWDQFGNRPFKTAEVKAKALADPAAFMAPPKLDDPTEKTYGKALGEAYSRLRGRRYDGYYLDRLGNVHGHVSQWCVFREGGAEGDDTVTVPDPDPADGGTGGDLVGPLNQNVRENMSSSTDGRAHAHTHARAREEETCVPARGGELVPSGPPTSPREVDVVALDLETGDAADLYRRGPGYVRLAGAAADDLPVTVAAGRDAAAVAVDAVRSARVVTGHNIVAFDLPALAREGVLSMAEIHQMAADGRLFDGLLAARYLDPPMARDKGVDATRKYDLGSLGQAYGLGAKLTDVSATLAKKYGGWDHIPVDPEDPDSDRAADAADFRRYLVQDVELSRKLYHTLRTELSGMPPYLAREHRVAALAAQMSYNGFRVDPVLLAERIEEINTRKAAAMELLSGKYGIPTHDAKGKAYASPLSTKAGKEALTAALRAAGATSLWTTEKTGEIQVSAEHMLHLGREYHHSPEVREIVKAVYRIVSARTVYETINKHLAGDRVHPKVSFKQATGRWSLTEPGLTVLGKRGGRHVERAVFLPDPGHVLVTADLSQVDMRAVAGLSGDAGYIEMLHHDDPHAEIARLLFGDPTMREVAKPIGHGWNYGRGIKAISESNDLDPTLVRQFDTSMRERFPRLVEWQTEVRALAESGALLDNGWGRPMRPDPQRAHTQGPALMGQGAARDIMMHGMLRLPEEIRPMLRGQIHDEIVLSVPKADVEDVCRAVVDALSFDWEGPGGTVPILADVSRPGDTWADCYSK